MVGMLNFTSRHYCLEAYLRTMASTGSRLSKARESQGLTVFQASSKTGLSAQQIEDFESDTIHPTPLEIRGILAGLGYSRDEAVQFLKGATGTTIGEFQRRKASLPPAPPFVTFSKGRISLHDRGSKRNDYCIEGTQVDSADKILSLIDHLSRKEWITKKHLRDFVRFSSQLLDD